ncbi:MAG: YihY/virulence factor BrkB family protein [Alphaproteobacteria bacterium]|nr:YihY/virulence factor BrkB family protein [Alphaproteobacteria bacterium]
MASRGPRDDLEPHLRGAKRDGPGPWLSTGITAALLLSGVVRKRARSRRGLAPGLTEFRARGRFADSPSQIPYLGWRDIVIRVYKGLGEDRIISLGAGVTFYAILAIFPGLAALVSIYGLFADPSVIADDVNNLKSILPPDVLSVVGGEMQTLISHGQATLGVTLVVSLAISLWSANSGMKALLDALNIVYHEAEKRSFVRLNAISLAFTVGMVAFGVLALAIVAVLPVALSYLHLDADTAQLLDNLRWPVLLVFIAVGVAVIYRYGPSREDARWRWVSWGSIVASVLWIGASMLFSWYTTSFGNYDKTYGSLGAAVVFMTWIWISNIVVLLGAELDAEMEHQTMRDTTTGRPRPLGERGAYMADTVGAPQD